MPATYVAPPLYILSHGDSILQKSYNKAIGVFLLLVRINMEVFVRYNVDTTV